MDKKDIINLKLEVFKEDMLKILEKVVIFLKPKFTVLLDDIKRIMHEMFEKGKKNYELKMWDKYADTLKKKIDSGFSLPESDKAMIRELIHNAKMRIKDLNT